MEISNIFCALFLQKTVVAVLNCFINPDWPYLPEKKNAYTNQNEKEDIARALRSYPDDPLNYHFMYNVLDADEQGRPPDNPKFSQSSKSALQYIAESNNKVIAWRLNS